MLSHSDVSYASSFAWPFGRLAATMQYMRFTSEHLMILASPEHSAGLGFSVGMLSQIVGKRSIDVTEDGVTYELAKLTPTHFCIVKKGQRPKPGAGAEIEKNYEGLRPYLPLP